MSPSVASMPSKKKSKKTAPKKSVKKAKKKTSKTDKIEDFDLKPKASIKGKATKITKKAKTALIKSNQEKKQPKNKQASKALDKFKNSIKNISAEFQKEQQENFNLSMAAEKFGFILTVYNFDLQNQGMDDIMTVDGLLIFDMHGPGNTRNGFWAHKARAWETILKDPSMERVGMPEYLRTLTSIKKRNIPNGPNEAMLLLQKYPVEMLYTYIPAGYSPNQFAEEFCEAFHYLIDGDNVRFIRQNYSGIANFGKPNARDYVHPDKGLYWDNLCKIGKLAKVVKGKSLREYMLDDIIDEVKQTIIGKLHSPANYPEESFKFFKNEMKDLIKK